MNRYIIYIVVALALLGGVWVGAVRFTDARLRHQIEAAQKKASDAEQVLQEERDKAAKDIIQAKADMQRYRDSADQQAKVNKQLLDERKALLAKLASTDDALTRMREDVANVPQSEVLARLRRALVELRKPMPISRPPAH